MRLGELEVAAGPEWTSWILFRNWFRCFQDSETGMSQKSSGIIALCFVFMAIIGCSKSADSSASKESVNNPNAEVAAVTSVLGEAMNTICPAKGNRVATDGYKVEYRGTVIGFCCPECSDASKALPEGDREIHFYAIQQ